MLWHVRVSSSRADIVFPCCHLCVWVDELLTFPSCPAPHRAVITWSNNHQIHKGKELGENEGLYYRQEAKTCYSITNMLIEI